MATITVTNSNDSGAGSLRAALASASAGDTINFAPSVTTIDLASSLVIAKNITIEGSQPGETGTPGVTINGGGPGSNFSDFTIDAGVTAAFDGLIIADGHAAGAAGTVHYAIQAGNGGAAAGGIYDSGALTLTNSVLQGDTAHGGAGADEPSFSIELDSHDVIIAEGALAEFFIDDDSRGMFHNAREYETLYDAAPAAAHYCAPRLEEGYQVEEARCRIAVRAGLLNIAGGEQPGPLRGCVDEASATRIAGWAQNPGHPDAPVCLDIFADGRMIGQVLANTYRADLWRAGIGSGHHAFTFVPPQDIALARVEVRRSLDSDVLRRGPNVGAFVRAHRRPRRA